jgi:hypothetical protein
MKHLLISLKYLSALALAVLAVGCASDMQSKENLAVAAGFKVITPSGPDQQAILASLPPRQVTPITYKGRQLFVLPDAANNRAYVGRQAEFQAYQQLRLAKQISNDNLMAAQYNASAAMNWGAWGGWGYGWGPGWY